MRRLHPAKSLCDHGWPWYSCPTCEYGPKLLSIADALKLIERGDIFQLIRRDMQRAYRQMTMRMAGIIE